MTVRNSLVAIKLAMNELNCNDRLTDIEASAELWHLLLNFFLVKFCKFFEFMSNSA